MSDRINSQISFGKAGKYQTSKDNGVQKSAFKNSQISEAIFKKYDKDKNGILDSSELKQLEADLSAFAGRNDRLGKREASKFCKNIDYSSNTARQDIADFFAQIGGDADKVDSAITQNGTTTVKYKPENNGQLTEIYKDDNGTSKLDSSVYTNNSDGSTLTIKYDGDEIVSKTLKKGAETLKLDPSNNDRLLKRTVDKGNGLVETTEYSYDDETGNVTETTKNQDGEVISVKVKDKNGNEIPQEPEPVQEEVQEPVKEFSTYTVQNGEGFRGLIKRSLQAQGIENPTAEQMEDAIKEFKENNPGAVKTAKNGNEYLLVGAKVKIAGGLEDKDNSEAEINKYKASLPKPQSTGSSNRPKNGKQVYKSGRYTITKNGQTKYYAADGTPLKQSYFEAVEGSADKRVMSKNGSGRYSVKTSSGETWYFAADGKAIKKSYYERRETEYDAVNRQKSQLSNAKKAFQQQQDSDGWAGKTADAVSALWGSDNRAVKVEADLKKYESDLNQLQKAQSEGPVAFNKKFREIYGVNYNPANIAAYEANPTDENYRKAYGTKNNIHKRVMDYNKSQQDGAAAVKTTVVVGASVAAAVATGGTSLLAEAAVAGGTAMAARATVELTDLASNNVEGDINAESVKDIAKQAAVEGAVAAVTAGTVRGAGQLLSKSASTASSQGAVVVSKSATSAGSKTGSVVVSKSASGAGSAGAKAGTAGAESAANAGAKAGTAGAESAANAGAKAGTAGAESAANAGAKAGTAGAEGTANAGAKAGTAGATSSAETASASAQNLRHFQQINSKVASGGLSNLSSAEKELLSKTIGKPVESLSQLPKSELRQLLLKFHPDKAPEGLKDLYNEIFQIINNLK